MKGYARESNHQYVRFMKISMYEGLIGLKEKQHGISDREIIMDLP